MAFFPHEYGERSNTTWNLFGPYITTQICAPSPPLQELLNTNELPSNIDLIFLWCYENSPKMRDSTLFQEKTLSLF